MPSMAYKHDSNGQPVRTTDQAILARQRKSLRVTLLPKIDSLPAAVFTPEVIGELAAVLQRRLPNGMRVSIVDDADYRVPAKDGQVIQ